MLRGNNSNTVTPSFLENHLQYPADISNQLQVCGNVTEEFCPDQQLVFSLNNKTSNNESDRKASMLNLNPVSTGLRLSYDDEERNSSITSASGSLTAASLVFPSLGNHIKRELDQQKKELDHFMRTQEENMLKGFAEIRQRHMGSFLSALEKSVIRKLHDKDEELQSITRKNKELVERVKQVTSEAQNWCYMAKYNESVVNALKTNLQQAMQEEGRGESDADDAASCVDPNNFVGRSISVKKDLMCKACKAKEVCILLMPCRHFCLCKECEGFGSLCPVCRMMTTASFEVYLS